MIDEDLANGMLALLNGDEPNRNAGILRWELGERMKIVDKACDIRNEKHATCFAELSDWFKFL